MRQGALIINGKPIRREVQPMLSIPVDANLPGPDSSLFRFVTRDEIGRAHSELQSLMRISYAVFCLKKKKKNNKQKSITPPDHLLNTHYTLCKKYQIYTSSLHNTNDTSL